MTPIYLDYNATTPVAPEVLDAMLPWLRGDGFGNPSSSHALGRRAHEAVEKARAQVASLINAHPVEIVFTGGGSEASNHAIKGAVFAKMTSGFGGLFSRLFGGKARAHLVISAVEHPATTQPVEFLRRLGCRVSVAEVDSRGVVEVQQVKDVLARDTVLVSVMHSNNEVGTLQPIGDIAEAARARGVLCHTDVAQSLGKVAVDVRELGVDLLTIAGHKLYAPKGVGALFVRRGVELASLVHGAGHEGGRRAGTENVPYVVGLGTACELAQRGLPQATTRLRDLRDALHAKLVEGLGDRVTLNGHPERRLPNTLNVNIGGVVGAELLAKTPEIAASTGSACHEGKVSQSAVLCAMRVPPDVGKGAVRLTVGRYTTTDDVERGAAALVRAARG